jgi:hypothetical protein
MLQIAAFCALGRRDAHVRAATRHRRNLHVGAAAAVSAESPDAPPKVSADEAAHQVARGGLALRFDAA